GSLDGLPPPSPQSGCNALQLALSPSCASLGWIQQTALTIYSESAFQRGPMPNLSLGNRLNSLNALGNHHCGKGLSAYKVEIHMMRIATVLARWPRVAPPTPLPR